MNKRLLFIGVSSMEAHAGQHKLYFLAAALGAKGIPVSVLIPDLEENRAFFATRPYVETLFYPKGNPFDDLRYKSRIVQQDRWSAVWIVGVGIRSFVIRGLKCRHIPIVKDFDEFPSMIESFGPLRRAYLRVIERRMIAQADGFTCASEFLENSIRQFRPSIGPRLLRLRVAISEGEHRVDPILLESINKADGGIPTLLYVGSVWRLYEEQLDEIIQLARRLRSINIRARVRVLGGGPDLEYFKGKATSQAGESLIEFAGHVPREQLATHMEAADVLVFPFPTNPFNLSRCPTKAFHYAAANRPVVTNKVGEVAALLGSSALYFPEHDIAALADCCLQALQIGKNFDNKIPFQSLTWAARADQFIEWLAKHNWLPSAPAGVGHEARSCKSGFN